MRTKFDPQADDKERLAWVTDCLVPQFFHNPFLVSLSAALEIAIFEIGDYPRLAQLDQ
jgi:hypothetical protein